MLKGLLLGETEENLIKKRDSRNNNVSIEKGSSNKLGQSPKHRGASQLWVTLLL